MAALSVHTAYAACVSRLGLSQAEAADLHGVRLDTAKSWSQGRRAVPAGAWDDLRAYEDRIAAASAALREKWEAAGSPPIDIDDSEAAVISLMAAADLVLTTTAPVHVGPSAATLMARQAAGRTK